MLLYHVQVIKRSIDDVARYDKPGKVHSVPVPTFHRGDATIEDLRSAVLAEIQWILQAFCFPLS